MKMDTGNAIALIVEAMLPEHTEDKILHICVEAYYLCFFNTETKQDKNNVFDRMEGKTFIHYIFYRPHGYTKVLRRESPSQYLDRENNKIFYMTSYHDSCWRQDGVESDLSLIHWRIMENMKKKYKKVTGRNMPQVEKLDQPNFCTLEINLLDGMAIAQQGYESRKYRLKIKDGKTNFIQVKEKKK